MTKTMRVWAAGLVFAILIGGSVITIAAPQTSYAAACKDNVLTFPTWYRGLSKTTGTDDPATKDVDESTCEIESPGTGTDGLSTFIWTIVLNVIEIAMQVVGYLAAGFIIYGGFKYITGAGSPDKITAGRKLILNAVIGLVISLLAVVIVNIVLRGFN